LANTSSNAARAYANTATAAWMLHLRLLGWTSAVLEGMGGLHCL